MGCSSRTAVSPTVDMVRVRPTAALTTPAGSAGPGGHGHYPRPVVPLLDGLLDRAVSVTETREPELDESLLWPEEAAALGDVAARRRWDFGAGRCCARLALAALGCDPEPVLVGERREPRWPGGVVGSITHTRDAGGRVYAAAAVARSETCLGLGVDAEPDEALPAEVVDRILHGPELEWAETTTAVAHPGRLVFCAKEATYKVWYPLTGRWLGFGDVDVTVDAGAGSFAVEMRVDGPAGRLSGRYRVGQGLIVVAIEVPNPQV